MIADSDLLTTSGVVAVITALGVLIGTYTKYMADKRKEDHDSEERTIARLEARVTWLEEQNTKLSEKIIEQSNELGYLRGISGAEDERG